ncbi:D-alanyl-D-alanine carboxypeptidase [Streptomyces katsurahamanus]|uniref:D-alanyl-D-alanine carboxypeptidase n=1 Tax=Streptomyces katsurahamanus TaxID=2577098 RepID=UPI002B205A6E|nr:D-alanyl-D-alanine carboxypeptidase [Streptomyces katsurahamanus]
MFAAPVVRDKTVAPGGPSAGREAGDAKGAAAEAEAGDAKDASGDGSSGDAKGATAESATAESATAESATADSGTAESATGDAEDAPAGPAADTRKRSGSVDADTELVAVNFAGVPPAEPVARNRPVPAAVSTAKAKADSPAVAPALGTPSGRSSVQSDFGQSGSGPRPAAQSVMPPPPLDLLAQLTNTPAPPPSPTRTLVRRLKIWTPLVALLGLVLLAAQILRPLPEPVLSFDKAPSSYTFGGGELSIPWPGEGQAAVTVAGSGAVETFGKQKPVPTASIAKIMTAYVILRDHPLKKNEKGPLITVDAQTVEDGKAPDESRIEGLRVGQTFNQHDMLKMLMIPSGNNIGRLLARWDSKSQRQEPFIKKMNDAAKDLGMKDTVYTDPSGLEKETVSTAVDQLILAEAVMKFGAFREVVALPNADIPGFGRIYNNNDPLIMAGLSIRGIKTGSNTPAGGTLSWAAYKTVDGKDQLILGTMMDQHAPPPDPNGANSLVLVQERSKKVIAEVREALTSATAVKKGQVLGHVDDGFGVRTPVVATKSLKAVGLVGQKLKLTVRGDGETISPTAKAGTVVGELTLGTGAAKRKVPVALDADLVEPSFRTKLTRLG